MKKKLNFKKETISNLENHQMKYVNGGETGIECYFTHDINCPFSKACMTEDCGCTLGEPCIVGTAISYSCITAKTAIMCVD
ncbi:MAG: class I lanthipeptide [Hyphomicrobiales bacterium]